MNLRFFKPNEQFWHWIRNLHERENRPIIDCGCGYGDLVREMMALNLPIIGIDPRFVMFDEQVPEDLVSRILTMPAEACGIVKSNPAILLCCRPCHSGFAQQISYVHHPKSVYYYIGLEKNVDHDLGDLEYERITDLLVGEEGEHIWQVHKGNTFHEERSF